MGGGASDPALAGGDRRRSPAPGWTWCPIPAVTVTGPVVIDSRSAEPGRAVRRPARRAGGRARLRAAAVAAGAVAVLATRPGRGARADRRRRPGRAGRLARAVVDRLPGLTDRRHHRLGGQDHHQGPGRPAGRAARARRSRRRLVQQRDRPPADRAARRRRTPATWSWSCPPAAPGTSLALCEIAPPRFGVVLYVGHAHAGEFGGLDGGGAGQGRAARGAARRTGWRCSTPTTRGCWRWPAGRGPGW